MSEVKVNKISPRSGTAFTLGDSGDTFTVPSGGTLAIACGATITNSGTQTGFGRNGTVNWQTSIKTSNFTAASGEGYFVNTTSGAITVTLPASPSAGDIVSVKDYAQTFDTNACTIGRNSQPIEGQTFDLELKTEGLAITLVYGDATKGWQSVNSNEVSNTAKFVTASGGTITTSGNFKIHTFTGPGTFCVSCSGNPAGSATVDYLVVAGGGGGGKGGSGPVGVDGGGGGGAGGYRESSGAASGCYTISPLGASVSALAVPATAYPITVGGGGTGAPGNPNPGTAGTNSVFSTITSAGGGFGASKKSNCGSTQGPGVGGAGGSGGGASHINCNTGTVSGGAGNTPPVSPAQGKDGGNANNPFPNARGGGGGGATAAGAPGCSSGAGGAGATSSINATPTGRAGGGGGAAGCGCAGSVRNGGAGGAGGGGNGSDKPPAPSGTGGATAGGTNTGGGGGGDNTNPGAKNGGSGIVIIRYKYQ